MGILFAGFSTALGIFGSAAITSSAWFLEYSLITQGLIRVGLGLAIGWIAKKDLGKSSPNQTRSFSVNGVLQRGGVVPQSFVFGRFASAGSLVWAEEWGANGEIPNAYLTQVIQVSDLPIRGLAGMILDGEKVVIESDNEHADYGKRITTNQSLTRNYSDHAWVKFYDGNQTVVDPFLHTQFNSNPGYPIDTNFIGKGNAYVILTTKIRDSDGDETLWSGFPKALFILDGIKLLSCATGEISLNEADHSNPVNAIYTFIKGLEFEGEWFWGGQVIADGQLNKGQWSKQALKAEAANYKCGGEVLVSDDCITVLDELLFSCAGKIAESGGNIKILAVAPDPPVATFHDEDILSSDPQRFTPFKNVSDVINGIIVNYPSADDNYEEITAPPLYSAKFEAEDDNRRLPANIESPFVTDDEQVQRLMQVALAEGRKDRRHAIPLPSRFWQLEPLDSVSWTSPENGYNAKDFLIVSMADAEGGDVVVDLSEVDHKDYKWKKTTDFTPIVRVPISNKIPAAQDVAGFSADTEFLFNANGQATNIGIRINWTPIEVDHLLFEVRAMDTEQTIIVDGRQHDTSSGTRLILQSFLLDTEYEVRVKYGTRPIRPTNWTPWTVVAATPSQEPTVEISDYLSVQGETLITSMKINVQAESRFYDRASIRYRKVESGLDFSAVSTGILGDHTINVVEDGKRYEIEVSLVGYDGNTATPRTYFHNVIGKIARPGPVKNFTVIPNGANVLLQWYPPDDLDLSHFTIKHSDVLTNANYSNARILVEKVSRPATSVTCPALSGTYFCRSYDKGGRFSETVSNAVLDIGGDLERGFTNIHNISPGPNFAGTYSKAGKVITNEIPGIEMDRAYFTFLNEKGTFSEPKEYKFLDLIGPWYEATYDFTDHTDLGASYYTEIRTTLNMIYKNLDDDTSWDTVSGHMDTWTAVDTVTDYTGSIPELSDNIDFDLLASVTHDSPASAIASWTDYAPIINNKLKFRGIKFRALLRSRYKYASPRVLGMNVAIKMPDRREQAADINITGNKTLLFSSGFYEIPSITVTPHLLNDGQRVEIYDKSKTGFKVRIKNANNSEATNTVKIDWVSNGYGEQ